MALAFALKLRDPEDVRFSRIVEITLDNSYPTGGYAITGAMLGFGSGGVIDVLEPLQPTIDGYVPMWDDANGKLKFFQCAGAGAPMTELGAAASVLNTKKLRVLVYAQGNQT
jgi:hypothetical protein